MNENVENLILEHLRVIRADMSLMRNDINGLRTEMTIMRQHMGGLFGMQMQTLHDGEIAAPKHRVERLEKRLDLID